jgi:hypothetical protein
MTSFIEIVLSIALVLLPVQSASADVIIEVSTTSGCAGMSQCK